jgi:hypothetical protein
MIRRNSPRRVGSIPILPLATGLTLMLTTSPADCQPTKEYGLKVGASIGRQDYRAELFGGSGGFMDHTISGLDVGAFLKRSGQRFFIQWEMHFVQKGSSDRQVRTDAFGNVLGTIRSRDRIDYLSVPVTVGLQLADLPLSPYVFAGPRVDVASGSGSGVFDREFEDLERFVVGTDIGAGIRIPAGGSFAFLLEVRYAHDWTDALRFESVAIRNSAFQVLLGIERRASVVAR